MMVNALSYLALSCQHLHNRLEDFRPMGFATIFTESIDLRVETKIIMLMSVNEIRHYPKGGGKQFAPTVETSFYKLFSKHACLSSKVKKWIARKYTDITNFWQALTKGVQKRAFLKQITFNIFCFKV